MYDHSFAHKVLGGFEYLIRYRAAFILPWDRLKIDDLEEARKEIERLFYETERGE